MPPRRPGSTGKDGTAETAGAANVARFTAAPDPLTSRASCRQSPLLRLAHRPTGLRDQGLKLLVAHQAVLEGLLGQAHALLVLWQVVEVKLREQRS